MYESLTRQWEDTTDEEKEAFRVSMRKQLDTLSTGKKLAVVGQISDLRRRSFPTGERAEVS